MPSLLEVRELTVRFGKGFCVGPASFGMKQGVLYVEGLNGSGKTTLLRAIGGELLPSDGQVLIDGQDVHRNARSRRKIAMVPSVPELPDFLSVTEAFEFTASLREAPDWNGADFCAELKLDPGILMGDASAGERRKAELVCALAGDPAILLLDETFTHLDVDSARTLREWIVKWSTSRLIILTHHGGTPVPADAKLLVVGSRVEFRRTQ